MPASLILGTHNAKKGRELEELLAPHGVGVVTLAGLSGAIEVVEDGATFADNARLKATQQALALRGYVLADDSGIEVDALGGAPGVFSARFAGPECDDERNNSLLLEKLAGLPTERRVAGYVCHVTLAGPDGAVLAEAVGRCRGWIATERRGAAGFGYDPLFVLREYHRTFGELGPATKRAISHRARAMRAILPALVRQLRRVDA